jgi:hypothetical protein
MFQHQDHSYLNWVRGIYLRYIDNIRLFCRRYKIYSLYYMPHIRTNQFHLFNGFHPCNTRKGNYLYTGGICSYFSRNNNMGCLHFNHHHIYENPQGMIYHNPSKDI